MLKHVKTLFPMVMFYHLPQTKIVPLSSPDLIRIQGPSKRSSSDLLYPVSSVKECNRKGGKLKSLGFYSHLFPFPSLNKVEASDRPKQAQHLPTSRKVQMELPESIGASLIPGEWVSLIDLLHTYLHIPILQTRTYGFATFLRCASLLPSLSA